MSSADAGEWRGLCDLRPDVERTLARSCRDHSELDDLVQETLLRAARFRSSLQDRSRLRPWLLRIAWNVMRDHVRRERRLARVEVTDEFLEELEGREGSPGRPAAREAIFVGAHEFDREDLLRILGELLPALSPTDRALYEAYYVQGLGCRRSAEQLSTSTQTIKMRLFRLRRRLRRELQRRSMLSLGPRLREREAVA